MVSTSIVVTVLGILAISLMIGFFSRGRFTNESFLLADRKLTTFQTSSSITSSYFGANTLFVYTAFVYIYGISAIWYIIGSVTGLLVFSRFGRYLKQVSEKGTTLFSVPDFFRFNYGKAIATAAVFTIIITGFGTLVNQFVAGGKLLSNLASLDYEIMVLISGVIIIIYLSIGGFRAIIYTDVFQYSIIVIVLLLFFGLSIHYYTSEIFIGLNFFEAKPTTVIGLMIYGVFSLMIAPGFWQRVYAAKDEETVKKSFTIAAWSYAGIGVFLTYIGLLARTNLKNLSELEIDIAVIKLMNQLLPENMYWVAILLFFAIILSSADTILFVISIHIAQLFSTSQELGKYLLAKHTQIILISFGVVSILVAIFFKSMVDNIVIYSVVGLAFSPLVLISWLSKKPNIQAMVYSFWGTIFTLLGIIIYNIWNGIELSPSLAVPAFLETIIMYIILYGLLPLPSKPKTGKSSRDFSR